MTLTNLLYAGKGECVGKWWRAQCAHGDYMLTYAHLEAHITSSYNQCPGVPQMQVIKEKAVNH